MLKPFTYFVGFEKLSRESKRGILCGDEKERVELCVGGNEKERERERETAIMITQ